MSHAKLSDGWTAPVGWSIVGVEHSGRGRVWDVFMVRVSEVEVAESGDVLQEAGFRVKGAEPDLGCGRGCDGYQDCRGGEDCGTAEGA